MRSSSRSAASAFFPASAPGGEETMPHVTVLRIISQCASHTQEILFFSGRCLWLWCLSTRGQEGSLKLLMEKSLRASEQLHQRYPSVPPGCRPGLCAGDLRFIQGEHCRDAAEMLLFSQADISRALPSRTSLRLKDRIQPTGYCLPPAVPPSRHPQPRCTCWGKAGPGTASCRAGL